MSRLILFVACQLLIATAVYAEPPSRIISLAPNLTEILFAMGLGDRIVDNTSAGDGDGIDVWVGTKFEKTLTGILCTFDRLKRDAEIKLLLGCTMEDVETILGFNSDMATLFIPNPTVDYDLSQKI